MRRFIREKLVNDQGKTVFWATHNLSEVEKYAHAMAIIDNGSIKAFGSMNTLTKNGEIPLQVIYDNSVNRK